MSLRIRRGLESQRLAITPALGETIYATDSRKFYIGDGTTAGGIFIAGDGGSGTANTIAYWVDADTLGALETTTYPTLTELSYIRGLTSAIQTQLNGKMTGNSPITGATKTKITYDSKGLVTAGADATTADIADSTNKRYVTDADLTKLSNLSGTNTGDQTITLTGDVTGSGTGSFAATIANDVVTYAKIQNVSATDRLLGRSSTGAGDIEEITCTSAGRALIDDADASAQRTTLGLGTIATQNANSVTITGNITGAWESFKLAQEETPYFLTIAPDGAGFTANRQLNLSTGNANRTVSLSGNLTVSSTATISGTNTGDQTITLTGDVTGSGTGSFATTIANGAVTNAKLQNSAITVNGTAISLGSSGTVTANTTNALTIGTGLSGTSFNGSSAVTIAIDSTVLTTTGTQTVSGAKTFTNLLTAERITEQLRLAYDTSNYASFTVDSAGALTLGYTTSGIIPNLSITSNYGIDVRNANGVSVRQSSNTDGVLIQGTATGTAGRAVTITPATLTANRTLTLPDATGTIVTTGDTGTVTNTMLAGSIANNKLTNSSVTLNGTSVSLGGSAVIATRVVTGTNSDTTPTPNADTTDIYTFTGLSVAPTFGAPTGTPVNGQKLIIRIKDNGTPRALGWNAAYVAGGASLPTTTVANKTMHLGFIYNTDNSLNKWMLIAKSEEA